jgi:flagellar basal body-associated protein FliL
MKKLTIILAVVVALAGATVSVLQWLQIGPFAPKTEDAGSAAAAKPAEPPRYIDLPPLVVPVFQGDAVVANIQVSLKVEANGAAGEDKIQKIMPRLNDALLRDLYAYIPRALARKDHLDVPQLKQRLLMVSRKVAGEDAIRDILIQSVIDNPKR